MKIKLTHLGFHDWHVDWETYECMSSFGVLEQEFSVVAACAEAELAWFEV